MKPSGATVIPTGRPIRAPSLTTNPVMKSFLRWHVQSGAAEPETLSPEAWHGVRRSSFHVNARINRRGEASLGKEFSQGASPPPEGPIRELIRWLNHAPTGQTRNTKGSIKRR